MSSPRLRVHWDRCALLAVTVATGIVATVTLGTAPARPSPRAAVAPPAPVAVQVAASTQAPPSTCPSPRAAPVTRAPGAGRTVALTFDDGPGPWTRPVLDVLRREAVPATFFVIGRQAEADPATVRAVVADGHLVGNHTWTHTGPGGPRWRAGPLRREVDRTQAVLRAVTGRPVCWFRPPYGITPGLSEALRGRGTSVALWSADTDDWLVQGAGPGTRGQERDRVRRIVRAALAPRADHHPVVLLHDGGGYRGATLAALSAIIDGYRARGYSFVRLDGR